MKRFLWMHLPPILYAILIFILSSIPSLKTPDIGFSLQDKVSHMIEFGILGWLLQRSFLSIYGSRLKAYLFVLLIGTAYAGLDEAHQTLVDGRRAEIGDWIADTMGILIAQCMFWIVRNRKAV